LLDGAREKGTLLVVDAGRTLAPPTAHRTDGEREQRRVKADAIARSFAAAGVDAMALGATDWTLGSEFVRGLVTDVGLPVLAANLTCGGSHPFPASVVKEQAGLKIGIVGVTLGEVDGCEVSDPREALIAAAAALPPVDVRLALVPVPDDRALATIRQPSDEAGPLPYDLVLDARNRPPNAASDAVGAPWLSGGSGNKKLGFLELTLTPGASGWRVEGASVGRSRAAVLESRLEATRRRLEAATDDAVRQRSEAQIAAYEKQIAEVRAEEAAQVGGPAHVAKVTVVDVEASVAEQATSLALVNEAKRKVTELAGADPATFVPRLVVDPTSAFAGGETCIRCHDEEHGQWASTPHARAWNGLVADGRPFDGDCWTCHVTAANLDGGPTGATGTAGFRDVQCEACHGPSRAHVGAPNEVDSPVAKPGVDVCVRCHDGKQDQGRFDAGTYLPRVGHGPTAAPGGG
jgi:hypothetical protein